MLESILLITAGLYAGISVLILSFVMHEKKTIPFLESLDKKHRLNDIQAKKVRVYLWCIAIAAALFWPFVFIWLWYWKRA